MQRSSRLAVFQNWQRWNPFSPARHLTPDGITLQRPRSQQPRFQQPCSQQRQRTSRNLSVSHHLLYVLMVCAIGPGWSGAVSGQDNEMSDVLGWKHIHAGMTDILYWKPSDPHLIQLKKTLAEQKAGYLLGPDQPIPDFARRFGVPFDQLNKVVLARPWRFPGNRPYLMVFESPKLSRMSKPDEPVRRVGWQGQTYVRWSNGLATRRQDRQTLVHGTEGDLRVCLAREIPLEPDDMTPCWDSFGDPAIFHLAFHDSDHVIHSQASGIRLSKDAMEIRRVRTYRSTVATLWLDQQLLPSLKKDFLRIRSINGDGALEESRYEYANRREGLQIFERILFKDLQTANHWKQAARAIQTHFSVLGFVELNYYDTEVYEDRLLFHNQELRNGSLEDRAARSVFHQAIDCLSRIRQFGDGDSVGVMERVYQRPGDVRLADDICSQLHVRMIPESMILYDRMDVSGEQRLRNIPDQTLRYYLHFGEDEVSAAAARIIGRRKTISLSQSLRDVAFDSRRADVVRAEANRSLSRLGLATDSTVPMTGLVEPKPIETKGKNNAATKVAVGSSQATNGNSVNVVKSWTGPTASGEQNQSSIPKPNRSAPAEKESTLAKGGFGGKTSKSSVNPPAESNAGKMQPGRTSRPGLGGIRRPTPSRSRGPTRSSVPNQKSNLEKIRGYLADLRNENAPESSHQAALHFLAAMDIPTSMRKSVFDSVSPFVTAPKITLSINAFRTLDNMGFVESDSELLIDAFDQQPRYVSKAMAKLPTPKILAFLGQRVGEATKITDPVFRTLEEIGTPAEKAAWPGLDHPDQPIQWFALRVLGKIGTKTTVDHLRDRKAELTRQEERTIQQIEERLSQGR